MSKHFINQNLKPFNLLFKKLKSKLIFKIKIKNQ